MMGRKPNTADPREPRREQVVHSRIWGPVRLLTERLNHSGYLPYIFDPAKNRWRYVAGGIVR